MTGPAAPTADAEPVAQGRPWYDGRRPVVLVTRRLVPSQPEMAGWFSQLKAFDSAGWATHVVVIRDDLQLDRAVLALREAGQLPPGTAVHCFGRRDRRVRASWWVVHEDGEAVAPKVADWLDWLTAPLPGAVVIVTEPEAYEYVAVMGNPVVARVAVVASDPAVWPPGAPASDLAPDLYGDQAVVAPPGPPTDRLTGVDLVVATDPDLATRLGATSMVPTEVVTPAGPTRPAAGTEARPGGGEPTTSWLELAARLSDSRWDRATPTLVLESLSTQQRVLHWTGILAGCDTDLGSWTCTLEGLTDPAGTLKALLEEPPGEGPDDDPEPHLLPTTGPTREVVVTLRSNALAYVANRSAAYRLEFSDGAVPVPVRTFPFDRRLLASLAGNATMSRRPGGTVEISPLPDVVVASDVDGKQVVRIGDGQPTSVTHALKWSLDLDWATFETVPHGLRFRGVFTASRIAPGDPPPALCVTDVAGRFRPVGPMVYEGEPEISGMSWRRAVAGILLTDPLVATTTLAGSSLGLHLGVAGGRAPIGELRTRGRRSAIHLSCRRGRVSVRPAPQGQMFVTPRPGLIVRAGRAAARRLGWAAEEADRG